MSYFLDTNMCIYFLKGLYPKLLSKMLSMHPSDIKVPVIVKAELFYIAEKSGKYDDYIQKISAFLSPFEIVPFGNSAVVHYSNIRVLFEKSGIPIELNNILIAATVLADNGILVTNNHKEFSCIPKLQIENWIE